MKHLLQVLTRVGFYFLELRQTERGATATEYGILMGFMAMVIVTGIGAFGIALNGVFSDLATEVQTALGIP